MSKICPGCSFLKEEANFNFKDKKAEKRQIRCKECTRKQGKNHYNRNKEYYLLKAQKRNKIIIKLNQEFIFNYLLMHPCVDCGEKDILVLTFDHQKDKVQEISKLIKYCSLETIRKEIAKCEVRCANCHAKRTNKQFGFYRYTLLAQQTEHLSSEQGVRGASPLQGAN